MSSTNRGYERHKTDYYVTPQNEIKNFLSEFLLDENIDRPDRMNWLDPCCGGDKENEASYLSVIKEEFDPVICGIDIREDSHADVIMDFLSCEKQNMDKHDIIISNPPFLHAKEFILKSLDFVNEGGYVIMLLRLNFFGSIDRKSLFEEFMPMYCYVHHKRMSFIPKDTTVDGKLTKKGSTDSIEYAHFVWKKGVNPEFTKLKVI